MTTFNTKTVDQDCLDSLIPRFADVYHACLNGWEIKKVEEIPVEGLEDGYGYSDFDNKVIYLNISHYPTYEANVIETLRHEIAHVIVGHGEHDLNWWLTLLSMNGTGVWVYEPSAIKRVVVSTVS